MNLPKGTKVVEFEEQSVSFTVGIHDGKIVLLFPTDISRLSLDPRRAYEFYQAFGGAMTELFKRSLG